MNMKSVTFRCSQQQHARLTEAMRFLDCTRTDLITQALEAFLTYAEQERICHKNLFELVDDIDASSEGPLFREQA